MILEWVDSDVMAAKAARLEEITTHMTVPLTTDRERTTAQLVARMDRLPILSTHVVWVLLLTANLALEYYDNSLFAYLLPQIMADVDIDLGQIGIITSAFFVGMVIGAVVGGRLADRFGRRTILVIATAVYSLGALATSMGGDFTTLLLARLFTGIGVQAATSVLLIYIAEMFPGKARGRVVSIVTSAFVLIAPLVGYLALVTVPSGGAGTWRVLFAWGGVGLVLIPLVLVLMPESVRWLASREKLESAFGILEKLEARALAAGKNLPVVQALPERVVRELTLGQIFRSPKIIRTIVVVALGYFGTTLGLYLVSNYSVYLLVDALGYSETKSYEIVTVWGLVTIAAPLLSMLLMDRFERKTLILVTSVLSAVPLLVIGVANNDWIVMIAGGLWSIFGTVVVSAFYTYIPESIPTEARGLGSGIIISVGRAGGIVSGVLGAVVYASGGRFVLTVVAAIAYVLFSLVLLFFGPRTTGRSLESVAAEEVGITTATGTLITHDKQ